MHLARPRAHRPKTMSKLLHISPPTTPTTPYRNVVLGPIPSLGFFCVRAWMLLAGFALNELWPRLFFGGGGDEAGFEERVVKDPLTKKAAKKASKKNK